MGVEFRSPKSEIRNPAGRDEIRNQNNEPTREAFFWTSDFALLSDFGFRASDFSRRFLLIDHAQHQPSDWTLVVAHRPARSQSITRNHHPLLHSGAMGIDGDLRRPFGFARLIDGLANDQPPPFQARMLSGGDYVAFNTG
jgi:hypothetical protein